MPTSTTRSSLRSSLQYRLGNRTDIGDTRLDEFLDRGLTLLSTKVMIRDLETLDTSLTMTVSDNSLAFPTNMVAIIDMRNTTKDRPIEFIEKSRFRQIKIVSGEPRQWTVIGTNIYFDRTPESADALSILGVSTHSWGAADGATPPIDPEYEYGLLLCSALIGFRDLGDSQRAALIENIDGTGELPIWVRTSKLPPIKQGLANRRTSGVIVEMEGYRVIE